MFGNQPVERVPMIVLKGSSEKLLEALQSIAGIVERRHTNPLLRILTQGAVPQSRPARRTAHRTVVGRTAVRTVRRKAAGGGIKKSSDPEPAGPAAPTVVNVTINIISPLVLQPAAQPPLPAPKGSWWRLTRDELTKAGIGLLAIAITALATKVF
jgi:hypothetical protein